jgi:SH3 domain-containing protein
VSAVALEKPRKARGDDAGFLLHVARTVTCVALALVGAAAFAADAPAPAASAPAVASSAPAAAAPLAASDAASAPAPAASSAPLLAPAPVVAPPRPAPTPRSRKSEVVQISDPYIELRTGPGRGYPIFFVAPRNDWIEIELRHTDWFRIRTEDNKVGWVSRQQLESTLTAAGSAKTFRDVLLDDYLTRKVQLGAAWGHFKSEPMLKLWTSYRVSDTLSVEGTLGQVQGVFSGTDLWHIDVLIEPWSDHRISPFFAVGVGKFKNFPNLSLIGAADTNAKLGVARVGVRYYLTERFVMSADYSLYTAFISDQRSTEYRAWTAGLSFFF